MPFQGRPAKRARRDDSFELQDEVQQEEEEGEEINDDASDEVRSLSALHKL